MQNAQKRRRQHSKQGGIEMTILMVRRKGYPEHRAVLKNGRLWLVPDFTEVKPSDIVSVRRWTAKDTQRTIDNCLGVVCRM